MDLRTELPIRPGGWDLSIQEPVLTMGSCFAHSIGNQLKDFKFRTVVNPFGTTYHPLSIHRQLGYAALNQYPEDSSYVSSQGVVHNFNFHSSFSHPDKAIVESRIQEQISAVHAFLKDCSVIVLTYGTAWIYERRDTLDPVANCHKMPASFFAKRLATSKEIASSFEELYKLVLSVNPSARFILTVSPVRHVKETLELNSLSKSLLRVACHEISQSHDRVSYFPSYEIMIDDLRDYRFYAEDLIHPTSLAEEYIWQKFSEAYFSKPCLDFTLKWAAIRKDLNHKAFHPDTPEHRLFLRNLLSQLEKLTSTADVSTEIEQVTTQLNAFVK